MTGNHMRTFVFVGVAWAGFATTAPADTVVMKSGKRYEGHIKSDEGSRILIAIGTRGISTTLRLDKKDIDRIERGAPSKPVPQPAEKPGKRAASSTGKTADRSAERPSSAAKGGAFLRLDLRHAIGRESLVFPESINDEGVTLEPRRGRFFVRLPVAYRLGEKVQHITRGRLRVRTGEGRLCMLRGIALDTARGVGALGFVPPTGAAADIGIQISTPSESDPLWERVTPKRREGVTYVECANSSHPKAARGERGTRRREPRKKGRARYDARTANGFVLFVLEVPEEAETLLCTVKSDPPVETKVDLAFLRALTQDASKAEPSVVSATSAAIASADGPIAQALVAQLAQMPAPAADTPDPRAKGFVAALSHPDADTRAAAWQALMTAPEVSAATLEAIGATDKEVVYTTIVAGARAELARIAKADANGVALRVPVSRRRASAGDESSIVPSDLAASAAFPNTFVLLNAVLRSKAAGSGEAAVDLVLADRTKQAVATLANVALRVQGTAIDRLSKIADPKLFVPVAKTLLLAPDPTLVQPLLKAASRMPIPIEPEGDPLVSAPLRIEDPVARAAVLRALAKMPLGDALASLGMRSTLEACMDPAGDARVHQAAIALIAAHWQPPAALPLIGGVFRAKTLGGNIMGLLTALVGSPDVAADVAAAAAAELVRVGAAGGAAAELVKLPVERQVEVINAVGKRAGRIGPRAAAFLATMAGSEKVAVAQVALTVLDKMLQETPQADRWRVRTQLKVAMNHAIVIEHSFAVDGQAKAAAVRVLAAAASLDAEAAEGLRTSVDSDSRTVHLATIAYARAEKPVGTYRLVAYADVKEPPKKPDADGAGRSGRRPRIRYDVPVDLGSVRIVATGETQFALEIGGRPLPLKHQSSRGRRGRIAVIANSELDPKPLVALVLERLAAPAQPSGLLGKLTSALAGGAPAMPVPAELLASAELQPLKLAYVAFGRWQGEIVFPRSPVGSGAEDAWPLVKVRVILEWIGPAPAN